MNPPRNGGPSMPSRRRVWWLGFLTAALLLPMLACSDPHSQRPAPSAAEPAVSIGGEPGYARRGLEALLAHLAGRDTRFSPGEVSLTAGEFAARCTATDGDSRVLICAYGPAGEPAAAMGILWREDGDWRAQRYPVAEAGLAAERQEHFREMACCKAAVVQARTGWGEAGLELLAIVDLGGPTSPMEEVHLLALSGGAWRVLWLPAPGNWNWGHAKVTLPASGMGRFGVRASSWGRQDRFAGYLAEPVEGEHRWFAERWVRRGSGFVLRDQVEEPGPYGALVRLIYYLSRGDEQRARGLLGSEVTVAEARTLLAQNPPQQGWKVERAGADSFRLDRGAGGKPDLLVRFALRDGAWVLTGLRPG